MRHVAFDSVVNTGGPTNGLRFGDLAFFQDNGGWLVISSRAARPASSLPMSSPRIFLAPTPTRRP